MNKYGNIKTEIDGITFDSKKESYRYLELKLLRKARLIRDLVCQPVFILQEGFTDSEGNRHAPITYRADFGYLEYMTSKTDAKVKARVVEDVKGFRTEVYKLKKKMFLYKYPDVRFVEI